MISKQTALSRNIATNNPGWAPRLAQEARVTEIEARLARQLDPDYAPAHQGLGAVLADIGDRARAQHYFRRGFRDHAVSTLPYRGSRPPVRLLQLISSGGGNIPTAPFLDDCIFQTTIVV